MGVHDRIRSVSQLKAGAARYMRELSRHGPPLVVTQNGEARAVLQDVRAYEDTQETLAMLKILALGQRQIETGDLADLDVALEHAKRASQPDG